MLKFLSRFRPKVRPEIVDAKLIYQKIMQQSRHSAFFGQKKFADNYDGRMEVLCLHLSVVLRNLRKFDENGQRLSQALYDVMVEDFDIALREEGLSDTGVARRIKPLAKMFFGRAKAYAGIFDMESGQEQALRLLFAKYIPTTHKDNLELNEDFTSKLAEYTVRFSEVLATKTLGEIASGLFDFPKNP
ncbi:MAG: hypothetical protein COA69_05125 [Robiginitomaculum sp.]|nr:MAG: hypothetical protein COA69_05125 [Robiginitomaculum sp.]